MTTFDRVAKILNERKDIPTEKIKPDSTFEELGLDSLDTVELVMDFEEEFGIDLQMEQGLKSISDFIALIDAGKK